MARARTEAKDVRDACTEQAPRALRAGGDGRRGAGSLRSCARGAALVLLSAVLALGMAGCKDSRKITEIFYDQSYETVDYDNPTKLMIQDENAEETSDSLPLVQTESAPPELQEETKPEEDDEDEENQDEADQVDLTALSGTGYSTSSNGTADSAGSGAGADEGGSSSEEQGSLDGGDGEIENSDYPEGISGNDNDTGGTDGARAGGETTYYDSTGDLADIPTGVDYVAAVGETATMVSVLAGDAGALLYTDDEWANRDNIQSVLGSKYNSSVQVVWTYEKDNTYTLSDEGLAAMIADEQLEAVLLTSGVSSITSDQQAQLEAAGIIVQTIPGTDKASSITDAMTVLGNLFATGDNANTAASSLASSYKTFHDDTVKEAADLANVEPSDAGSAPVTPSESPKYTVYVSDWVDDVDYVGASAGLSLDTSDGLGVVTLGYKWSPMCYYLSVGGAVNTAAERGDSSGTALLWGFNTNHVSAFASDFTKSAMVSSYQVNSAVNNMGTAYGWTYLCSSSFVGAGTTDFPCVIVNTQSAKGRLEASRDAGEGVNTPYKIYGVQTWTNPDSGARFTWVGPLRSDEAGGIGFSVMGLTSQQSAEQSLDDITGAWDGRTYQVLVNPCGLFESWTDGTIESVLEAAWISYYYNGGSNPSQAIADFYGEFYGYSLSSDEIAAILNGLE